MAALVVVLAAFREGIKKVIDAWFNSAADRIARRRYAHGLDSLAQALIVMDGFRHIPNVQRILCFSGRNSGGLPEAGKPYWVRAYYGWSSHGDNVFDKYNFDIAVDNHYVETLAKVVKDGRYVLTTEKEPDGSLLKNLYLSDKVVQSRMYYLKIKDNNLYYFSVASYEREFTMDEIIQIDLITQRLRSVLD